MSHRKISIHTPGGFVDSNHSRGGLIGEGAYKRWGQINFLKIFNSELNIYNLRIENKTGFF